MNQIRSLNNDIQFGLARENIESTLCHLFNDEFKNTKELYNNSYHPYDFESLNIGHKVELKSRRVTKRAYPTTIVPCHKVKNIQVNANIPAKYIFVFQFTDKMCYIEYNPELFDTFEKRLITTQRAGIVDVPKPHFLIPIDLLIDIST